MNYLLDTNAVSEWTKPRPDSGLMRWMHTADEDHTYLSAITVGELRKGVERLKDGRRKDRIEAWISDDLLVRFERRILPVDIETANVWGRMMARAEEAGSSIDGSDGLIGATAYVHDLEVVTRNSTHFEPLEVRVHNPWNG